MSPQAVSATGGGSDGAAAAEAVTKAAAAAVAAAELKAAEAEEACAELRAQLEEAQEVCECVTDKDGGSERKAVAKHTRRHCATAAATVLQQIIHGRFPILLSSSIIFDSPFAP